MILRVIRGRAGRSELAALRSALESALGQGAHVQYGLTRFHVGWRETAAGAADAGDEVAVAIDSFWASAEHAARGDAREISPFALGRRHLRDLDVRHFEIDETILRSSEAAPIAVRLATGRFSKPGADAEMLNLLRQRAPLIGDEMTEAFVGRRIDGRAVEVTFVSAWGSVPAGRPLETALWPDIALRYDEFNVEVYESVGVESA